MTASLLAAVISLSTFLGMLNAPPINGAEDINVVLSADGPEGLYAVACDREMFGDVPGNAQALCGDLPDRSILVWLDAIPDRRTLLSVLKHESVHFELGVNVHGRTPWERFNEAVAYALGNLYAARAMKEIN